MTTTFSKSDLLTGDMIMHRNGKVSTVLLGTAIGDVARYHTDFNSFSYLSNINDDLTHNEHKSLDIVAVYRVNSPDISKSGDAIANPDKMLCADNLVWERPSEDIIDCRDYSCCSCGGCNCRHNTIPAQECSEWSEFIIAMREMCGGDFVLL